MADPDLPPAALSTRAQRRRDSWTMMLITIGSAIVIMIVLLAAGAFTRSTG
ncbi:MAG TPA: hypothetical protein VF592_12380 [Sphingomonas sp.]|jgi:hypothetical protein|uniref:hypothetical protein n=1 Tax=Sphingomonas sp. TaxID=28214 RepID=UPI002ED8D257